MSKQKYKIKSIEYNNLLVEIPKPKKDERVNGIIVQNTPKAHRIGRVVMAGSEANEKYKPETNVVVYVQALNYQFDADVEGLDTTNNDYFIIFDSQVEAVVESSVDEIDGENTSV